MNMLPYKQFVDLVELYRKAEIGEEQKTSTKWWLEKKRLQNLVDNEIQAFRRDYEKSQPTQGKLMFDDVPTTTPTPNAQP